MTPNLRKKLQVLEATGRKFGVSEASRRKRRRRFPNIDPKVEAQLSELPSANCLLAEMNRMKPYRQKEVLEMMISHNTLTSSYCRALVALSPKSALRDRGRRPEASRSAKRKYAELEELDGKVQSIGRSLGWDALEFATLKRYVSTVLESAAIVRYLAGKYPAYLTELQRISAL